MRIREIFEANSPLDHVYGAVDQNETFRNNPDYEELEQAWVGGVADFGTPEAADAIQAQPDYYDYRDSLVQAVRQHLGDPFRAWRLTSPEQLEDWQNGDDLGAISVAITPQAANAFRNFARNAGKEFVLLQFEVPAEAVIMRGQIREQELVINGNDISADTITVVG